MPSLAPVARTYKRWPLAPSLLLLGVGFRQAYSKNNISQNRTTKLAYNTTIRIEVAGRGRTKESLDDTIVRDGVAGCRNERLGQCEKLLDAMANLQSPNTARTLRILRGWRCDERHNAEL
jgi:hypothetical protein